MPIPQLTWKGKAPKSWRGAPEGFRRRDVPERRSLRRRIPQRAKHAFRWLRFRRGQSRRRWIQQGIVIAGIAAILLLVVGVAMAAWYAKDLPNPDQLLNRKLAESTKIYDRTGQTVLYEIHGEQRRTVVQLEDIPLHLRQATIAIEDQNFYQHYGFSVTGFIRAAWINLISGGRRRPGGSTITQQFVKNSILTSEKTVTRKFKELVLSFELERKFSKDQILQLYLNEIPYGSNNYGVQAAAANYFGKDVRDLTLAESATLAALPQAPTFYSPYGNNTDALSVRQRHILALMENLDFITPEEREAAEKEEITFQPKREQIIAPHFVFYVREQLVERFGESVVETGGLKVITTLDMDKQRAAEKAVTEGVAAIEERYNATNGALVALDPKTGEVLAMVGSRDYFDIEHDGNVNVTLRPRQPGSSFKPVVYATAFRRGYTPDTMLFDLTTDFQTGSGAYTPHNYDNREHGPLPMRRALAGSLNIPAVKTLYLAGLTNVLDLAHDMGYTTLNEPDRYGLALVLGGGEVRLLDHVSAFAVFAREGLKHPTHGIAQVQDKNGKTLFEQKVTEERVLEEYVAREINSILSDDASRAFIFGSGSKLTLPGRPVAAKTGTTNDFHDGWTVGFTPSLAAGVWVGNNDNTEMARGADGVFTAAPIWNAFMRAVLDGTPVETFKTPDRRLPDKPVLRGEIDEVTTVKVDKLTGKRIPDSCLATYPPAFIADRVFKETHTILHTVRTEDPQGDPPQNPADDPQYTAWEGPVQRWAAGQPGYGDPASVPEERCDLREGARAPTVQFREPTDRAEITTASFDATVRVNAELAVPHVVLTLGGTEVAQWTAPPFTARISLRGKSAGFYDLRATATDEAGQEGSATIRINYLPPGAGAVISVTDPSSGTTIATKDFPITLKAFASDPDGVVRVEWFIRSSGDSPTSLGTSEPKNTTATLRWADAPDAGTYELYAQMTDEKGNSTTSDIVVVTVS
ncbi:MAG: PBP1A family penicillin-binding protein [Candidatus Kerfeldbacteria bacterium]|nr:PBP1A family penicillin-binding protein [Candidatus Kerfeldbacteria bacterium]